MPNLASGKHISEAEAQALADAHADRVEADAAFNKAIVSGRLSDNPAMPNYAGNYMYMGSAVAPPSDPRLKVYRGSFKHINTRQYLP